LPLPPIIQQIAAGLQGERHEETAFPENQLFPQKKTAKSRLFRYCLIFGKSEKFTVWLVQSLWLLRQSFRLPERHRKERP